MLQRDVVGVGCWFIVSETLPKLVVQHWSKDTGHPISQSLQDCLLFQKENGKCRV